VAVTAHGDGLSVAADQPGSSIRLTIDIDKIAGGSAVLTRILTERIHGTGDD
jgi:hypothetical protein